MFQTDGQGDSQPIIFLSWALQKKKKKSKKKTKNHFVAVLCNPCGSTELENDWSPYPSQQLFSHMMVISRASFPPHTHTHTHRLVGLVVKASASRASWRFRVRIPLAPGFFRGRVIPVSSKLALQWIPCQAPGVVESVLGLVDPVSVYCDWVRWKIWSAASISVWLHVELSEQIRPWDTLTCCWDVKHPTNKQTPHTFGWHIFYDFR